MISVCIRYNEGWRKTHSSFSWTHSFRPSQLVSTGKGWSTDWPVNQELCSPAQLPSGIVVYVGTDWLFSRKRHTNVIQVRPTGRIQTGNGWTGSWTVVTGIHFLILRFYSLLLHILHVYSDNRMDKNRVIVWWTTLGEGDSLPELLLVHHRCQAPRSSKGPSITLRPGQYIMCFITPLLSSSSLYCSLTFNYI